jgi:N-acetylmuramoyl-L-alanine amidase
MNGVLSCIVFWLIVLLAFSPSAGGARPGAPGSISFELQARGKTLGQVPVVVAGGEDYVSADRLAAVLGGKWITRGGRGTLTVGARSADFTRDTSRVVLEGQAVALGSPPRIEPSGWLLPEGFLARGLAKLVPGAKATRIAMATAKSVPAKTLMTPSRPAPPSSRLEPPMAQTSESSTAFRDLRHRSYPSFTRIVVETGGPLRHVLEPAPGEARIRMTNLALGTSRTEVVEDGLIGQIRLEPAGDGAVLRATLATPAGEIIAAKLEEPHRLVLDVLRPKAPPPDDSPRLTEQGLRLIVIDPGHGGHDPGATGPSGTEEKDVVLDVSRRVARMVEEGLGVKVAMTRSTDVFIPLRDRTNFANRQRADLFVSIHANAHARSFSEGVETYFLSSEATDNEARQVAASENGVVQLESPTQRQRTDALKSILWDLAQSEFQQESSFLAETVQDLMTRSLELVNRGVKQAGFYVLGGAAMPAILIEVGFITNPREERKLASAEHREAVARAIYAGLAEYKRRHDQRMRTVRTRPERIEAR